MSECVGPETKHVVAFSSGAGSWAAARAVAAKHGTDNLYLLFCDVKGDSQEEHSGEDEDNYRFLKEAAADVGGTFVRVAEGRDVWQIFEDQRFIGNSRVSNCSRTLKQEVSRRWLNENCCPCHTVVYVGIDWSESHRLPAIVRNHEPYKAEAPLCDPPYLTKDQVLADLEARGIKPPRLYGMGFAHANCGGFCVRAGQGQFKHLLEVMPERYAYHEQKEGEFRERIGKNVAILRDRRGGESKPLTLRQLRLRVQQGGEVDVDDIGGCGCYATDEGLAAVSEYDLPEETYKVFPDIFSTRNSYDSRTGVKIAIGQRARYSDGNPIRVFRAKTVWEDVTEEFVRPHGENAG